MCPHAVRVQVVNDTHLGRDLVIGRKLVHRFSQARIRRVKEALFVNIVDLYVSMKSACTDAQTAVADNQ